jgi:5-amino-6-(5-phosphoribosylamino)uracil reductase
VRGADRRARRVAEGRAPTPRKVTLTRHPGLDPRSAIFAGGDGDPLVYCATPAVAATRERLGAAATVVDAGASPQVGWVADDLGGRGVRRLMVEGGRHVLEQFLAAQLADELQLVVAPVLVGDPRAPRFVADVRMPGGGRPRADLAEVRRIEDVVLLRYALSARFEQDDQGGTTR